MRVLLVASYFGGKDLDPWLLDDLAIAIANAGDEVDVLVHDAKHGRERGRNDYPDKRVRVFSVGPTRVRQGRFGKFRSYLACAWGLHTRGFRHVRRRRYDLCIYTSIGTFSWGLPSRLRRDGIARRSIFVLWDFFPIHHVEIGRIKRNVLHAPLRALERLSMANADAIAVMSPANERFLRTYHPRVRGRSIVVPPWASDPGASAVPPDVKRSRFTVIFGGQLATGRGVDTLLRAARQLVDDKLPVDVLIVGDGPARTNLMALANTMGVPNTTFVAKLPREEYRRLLQSVHVGVAVTVTGVTPPTFPSKIVEYCAAGVPVIVCVEAASDAGTIVEAAGAGLAARAGDAAGLASAIRTLYQEHLDGALESRARKALALFDREFSVKRAADALLAVADRKSPL
jgi:glycosyltransferase involved in cell wall biosynthesis